MNGLEKWMGRTFLFSQWNSRIRGHPIKLLALNSEQTKRKPFFIQSLINLSHSLPQNTEAEEAHLNAVGFSSENRGLL